MAFQCRVERDSVSPEGIRLTTLVISYPRFIHSEMLTHRDRARNSASSRAIPWPKMMAMIETDPVIPIKWGAEQRGMQSGDVINNPDEATRIWLEALDNAVKSAQKLAALGVHKSLCNRVTEPWMWITVVMSATNWKNFFALRCHEAAEVHFQKIAGMMRDCIRHSQPKEVEYGQWHLPFFLGPEDLDYIGILDPRQVCTGRAARVSYLTHDGRRSPDEDVGLFSRLCAESPVHASPLEHVATPARPGEVVKGCFRGWKQYRHEIPNESVPD